MMSRTFASVFPRQSPSSLIFLSSDAEADFTATGLFTFTSNARGPGKLRSRRSVVLLSCRQREGGDAAMALGVDRPNAEQPVVLGIGQRGRRDVPHVRRVRPYGIGGFPAHHFIGHC